MSPGGPLHEELARLERERDDAAARWQEAKLRRVQDVHLAASGVVSDLAALRDAVQHRQPHAPPAEQRPAREREETLKVLDAIRANEDLVLAAVGPSAGDLRIVDLSIERDFAEADRALVEASRAAERFERDNAEALKAEADAARMEEIRGALDGENPELLRELIEAA